MRQVPLGKNAAGGAAARALWAAPGGALGPARRQSARGRAPAAALWRGGGAGRGGGGSSGCARGRLAFAPPRGWLAAPRLQLLAAHGPRVMPGRCDVWRRSSRQEAAAAPVSGSKNRTRSALEDCLCDRVRPSTRADAADPPSIHARTHTRPSTHRRYLKDSYAILEPTINSADQ